MNWAKDPKLRQILFAAVDEMLATGKTLETSKKYGVPLRTLRRYASYKRAMSPRPGCAPETAQWIKTKAKNFSSYTIDMDAVLASSATSSPLTSPSNQKLKTKKAKKRKKKATKPNSPQKAKPRMARTSSLPSNCTAATLPLPPSLSARSSGPSILSSLSSSDVSASSLPQVATAAAAVVVVPAGSLPTTTAAVPALAVTRVDRSRGDAVACSWPVVASSSPLHPHPSDNVHHHVPPHGTTYESPSSSPVVGGDDSPDARVFLSHMKDHLGLSARELVMMRTAFAAGKRHFSKSLNSTNSSDSSSSSMSSSTETLARGGGDPEQERRQVPSSKIFDNAVGVDQTTQQKRISTALEDLRVNEAFDAFLTNEEDTCGAYEVNGAIHVRQLEGHVRKRETFGPTPRSILTRSYLAGFYGTLSGAQRSIREEEERRRCNVSAAAAATVAAAATAARKSNRAVSDDSDYDDGQKENSRASSTSKKKSKIDDDDDDNFLKYVMELNNRTFMARRPSSAAFSPSDVWQECHVLTLDNTGIVPFAQVLPVRGGLTFAKTKQRRRPKRVKSDECYWVPLTEQHFMRVKNSDVRFVNVGSIEVNEFIRLPSLCASKTKTGDGDATKKRTVAAKKVSTLSLPSTQATSPLPPLAISTIRSTAAAAAAAATTTARSRSSETFRWALSRPRDVLGNVTPRKRTSSITGFGDSPRRATGIMSPGSRRSFRDDGDHRFSTPTKTSSIEDEKRKTSADEISATTALAAISAHRSVVPPVAAASTTPSVVAKEDGPATGTAGAGSGDTGSSSDSTPVAVVVSMA
eukprot:g2782.t1